MDEALVQHTENDVDRNERGEDKQPLVRERVLKRRRSPLVVGDDAGRQVLLLELLVNGFKRGAKRGAGREIEGDGDCRELTLVVDRKGFASGLEVGKGTQRYGVGESGRGGR